MKFSMKGFAVFVCSCLALGTAGDVFAQADQSAIDAPAGTAAQIQEQMPEPLPELSPGQLQQLVAPIALYPDALVAQILAAAANSIELVEADRWIQAHPDLQGSALADEVNKQSWDPSVKALTEFPSVLANLDKNLEWTSSLGDAYMSQPQALMAAVQVMRQRAEEAGSLDSTGQEAVATQGQTITIEPANPDVVYVPEYDPWLAYGAPVPIWPGWYPYSGLYLDAPGMAFGVGFGLGIFGGYSWGWHHWSPDWHHRAIVYDHHAYVARSQTLIGRNSLLATHASFGARGLYGADRFAGPHGALESFGRGEPGGGRSFGEMGRADAFHGGGGHR